MKNLVDLADLADMCSTLAIRSVYEPAVVQLFIISYYYFISNELPLQGVSCNTVQYYAMLRLETDLFCWFRI